MKYRAWLDYVVLVSLMAITRVAFRSHYLYDVDSVNFALALDRFDPSAHQPHPPGYFLYVCLGRLANEIFQDANTAFVAISILAGCGAMAMIIALTRSWFDASAARFAGLIFLLSPLVWFHGTVALTYIVEAFFSALAGYLCWRVNRGSVEFIVPGAIVVGIAAGFRPSSILFLGPLLLFSCRGASLGRALAGLGTLALTVLAWLVPMIRESGGLAIYTSSLLSLWQVAGGRQTVFNSAAATSIVRFCCIAGIYLLCFGCAAMLPLRTLGRARLVDPRIKAFTWVWVGPGLLFFTFIFLRFVNSGYLLILCPPVCGWLGYWASSWYAELELRRPLKLGIAGGLALVNFLVYLYAPVYCSFTEVRKFEAELESVLKAVQEATIPLDTLIVGFDSHFLGYRHAGYYLPRYRTVQFPEVQLPEGRHVFAMQHRNTGIERRLPVSGSENFILFPLPTGAGEYRNFMSEIQARFPEGTLLTIASGERRFVTGRAPDLHFLFPQVSGLPLNVHEDTRLDAPIVNSRLRPGAPSGGQLAQNTDSQGQP